MSSRTLLQWVAAGALPPDRLEQALALTGAKPDAGQTLRLLDRLLLIAALLCACSGVIFFFAYNWDAMARLHKFALAQAVLVLSLLPLLRYPLQGWIAQACLFAAGLLLGALLALIGQTYQTGADTFELFLIWALLLLPWAGLGRSLALAGLILLLCNLALVLAFNAFSQIAMDMRFVLMLALNLLAWLPVARRAWQQPSRLWALINGLLLCWLLCIATGWALASLWREAHPILGQLVLGALLALQGLLYGRLRQQKPLLIPAVLAATAWVMALGARLLPGSWQFLFGQGVLSLLVALGVYLWFRPRQGDSHEQP